MKYVVTPDLLTILNEEGDEFTVPIHSAEYAILLVIGIEFGPRFDYGCFTLEICATYQSIPPNIKHLEKVVQEMLLSKLMFITYPAWMYGWLNVVNVSFTEKYVK
jgi:hypothetical protein